MMNDQSAPPPMPPGQIAQPQQPGMQQMMPDVTDTPAPTIPKRLKKFIESDNIATMIEDEKLLTIGMDVCNNTELDDESRTEWKKQLGDALKVAKQIIEERTTPWPDASNVKLPLILTACIQFNSRTFPQLVQNDKVVKIESLKAQTTEQDLAKANDLSCHMSYQLTNTESDWVDNKDKLLMVLPLLGTVFTKTYYDPIEKEPQVDLCLPDEIIIHQKAKSIAKAQRITHVFYMSTNDIITRQRKGIFLDIPIKDLIHSENSYDSAKEDDTSNELEKPGEKVKDEELSGGADLHKMQEQCCYLDLDDDDYAEPYIVTVHVATKKVMRIVAFYDEDSFVFTDDGKTWIKINQGKLYTAYKFLPSFDNTFYGMGFSQILYPINAAANSVINRLMDAGTLSNMQSGFIGKGVRMRKQTMRLRPGEWATVSTAAGIDLSRNIVPIPTKEPSTVLYELLGLLIKTAQEISGVSDVMQGQLPPANTPATTVVNLISEGSKVFSAINIRLYDAMNREFHLLFELNKKYLTETESFQAAQSSGQISVMDYRSDDYGIRPVSNPAMGTEAKNLAVMQGLMSVKDDPILNKQVIYKRFFDAMHVPNNDDLFAPPPPPNAPPPPEMQKILEDINLTKMKIADIATDIEKKGIELDMKEKQLMIDAENIGSLAAERKINSISVIEGVRQTDNQQKIDAAKQEVEQMTEESTPDVTEDEPQIQQFGQEAAQASGLQPPAPPAGAEPPGAPPPAGGGGDQGLQQSLADKMEQTAPQPQQPQGGEKLPLGEKP